MSDVRSKLLGNKPQLKTETVEFDGEKFKVTEMSLKQRRKLVARSRDDKGELDGTLFQIYSIIYCVLDEKGNRVFEETDAEMLEEYPANSPMISTFSEAIGKLAAQEGGDVKNV